MTGAAPRPGLPARPPRLMPLAVAGSALLAAASAGLFYYASRMASGPPEGMVHRVTVGAKTCDPQEMTVPAGRTTFEIHNASSRTLEWEILDGVMVVEERENITPGLRVTLTTRLKPGRYQITCGLLSNPRGTLVVTPSAESEAERERPPLQAFIGPLSEYRVSLMMASSALAKETAKLAEAIGAGDIDAARAHYLAARLPYRRLDMVSGRFSDLKNAIDPLADYLAERERDPGFTGFHRIEYGLFAKNALDGLQPVAERLAADVATLGTRIRALRAAPEDLALGVERQARLLADGQIRKGESRYALSDLDEFEASFEGMEKSLDLLAPLVASPEAAASLARARADIRAEFDRLKQGGAYPPYDRVDEASRERLAKGFAALAEAAGRINRTLGLD